MFERSRIFVKELNINPLCVDCRQYNEKNRKECLSFENCPVIHETTERISIELRGFVLRFLLERERGKKLFVEKATISVQNYLWHLRNGLDILVFMKKFHLHHLESDQFHNSFCIGIHENNHKLYTTSKDSIGLAIRKYAVDISCLRQGLELLFKNSEIKVDIHNNPINFERLFYELIIMNPGTRLAYLTLCLKVNGLKESSKYSFYKFLDSIDHLAEEISKLDIKYRENLKEQNFLEKDDSNFITKAFLIQKRALKYVPKLLNGEITFPKNTKRIRLE